MTPPRVTAAVEVDHVVPLSKGGADDDDNRQGLCVPCHQAKTARDLGVTQHGCDSNGLPIDTRHHWYRTASHG